MQFSPMLRHSFFALTIRFSDDSFFSRDRAQAVEYYKASASKMLFPQTTYPTASLDVLRTFCLLILNEIEGQLSLLNWPRSYG